jgi:PhnB protein
MTKREAVFTKDFPNKTVSVVRTFDASLEKVWQAWTESEILDQWWAPKPYKAVTKKMDFREGGFWLYAMTGPEGDQQWCIENFKTITLLKLITNAVSFCDEEGVANKAFPTMHWKKAFSEGTNSTTVTVEITYDTEADMQMFIGMGMQEGFTAGLDNLDEYLNTKG